jgi:hypothetical protein
MHGSIEAWAADSVRDSGCHTEMPSRLSGIRAAWVTAMETTAHTHSAAAGATTTC